MVYYTTKQSEIQDYKQKNPSFQSLYDKIHYTSITICLKIDEVIKMRYGYVRVSTKEQNEDRQLIALEQYKISKNNIFVDKQSGRDFKRKNYKKLLRKLRKNDVIVIKSIDRLGRNYSEIQEQWQFITKEKKADIIVIDMPILDTTNFKDTLGTLISDIVLQVLSFVAENECKNIKQRQAEGIAAAKARGVKFGRPTVYNPEDYRDIFEKRKNKEISQKEAVRIMGVSEMTYYKIMHALTNSTQNP